jgi:beta-glucosidase
MDTFHVGFATSVYQTSGDPNTNWGTFENQRNALGMPTISNGAKCGVSCDFWNLYAEDIKRAYSLGSTCFRFSIEWSRIEPQHGVIDEAAIQRYHQIFDCLERYVGGTWVGWEGRELVLGRESCHQCSLACDY